MNKNRGRLLVFCEIPRFARDDRRQQMQPAEAVRYRYRGATAEGRELEVRVGQSNRRAKLKPRHPTNRSENLEAGAGMEPAGSGAT